MLNFTPRVAATLENSDFCIYKNRKVAVGGIAASEPGACGVGLVELSLQ